MDHGELHLLVSAGRICSLDMARVDREPVPERSRQRLQLEM